MKIRTIQDTVAGFPGIYNNNNNNNNIEKPNKNWGEKKIGCGGVIPTLNMFIFFVNRKKLN